ncbi:MAG: DEAD/DEAH box helicase [Gemmatimonadota bacterium]|nr:DEAD/DEAH box helicase [Gemmatimonadota bacterium]
MAKLMMNNNFPSLLLPHIEAREWQQKALAEWLKEMRGVASVVTGGGKTIFSFLCIQEFWKKFADGRVIILVPTITLLDQWHVSLQEDLGVPAKEIACFSSQEKEKKPRAVNVLVINSGRHLVRKLAKGQRVFLIVDECHRAGSPENAKALQGEFAAALGLSATPQREYDLGFQEHVVPALGAVIFEYDYSQAYEDGVIAPFELVNVQVDLLVSEQKEYYRLTKRAAVLLHKAKDAEARVEVEEKLKRILQMRAAISATAKMKIPVSAKIVEQNRGARTIVFHERTSSAKDLFEVLRQRNHSVCLYHSRITPEVRRDNLRLFRRGVFDVLISCRALDEGMDVPETTVALIASSTASLRQRIQRLGRVLRPSKGKQKAIIYTLYATKQEYKRLLREAERLEGMARVQWSISKRQAHR